MVACKLGTPEVDLQTEWVTFGVQLEIMFKRDLAVPENNCSVC